MLLFVMAAHAQSLPNVLLVVADDVGVDKLSDYVGDIPAYVPDPEQWTSDFMRRR